MIAAVLDPADPARGAALLRRAGTRDEPAPAPGPGLQMAHATHARAATAGSVHCVLEGRVHNSDALAATLGLAAGTPAPQVIARVYAAWDLLALERLRGTFALALWDSERRTGLLASDHFGVHSWYVRASGDRLVAATDMSVLRRIGDEPAAADRGFALCWIAGAWPPAGRTFLRGVSRVRGGEAIVVAGGRATRRMWWAPRYREPLRAPRAELAELMRAQLGGAIGARMAGGETTGVILSGGFDSSAVAGVAATEAADVTALRTYSAVFPHDPEIDESGRVRDVVRARGLHSHLLHVHPAGLVRRALEFQRDWGVPVVGPGYLLERPLLEQAARDGVLGVLDGQGGDEVFGFSPLLVADRLRRGRVVAAVRLLTSFPDQRGRPPRRVIETLLREYGLHGVLPQEIERRLRRRGDPNRHRPELVRADMAAALVAAHDPREWKRGDGPLWWRWMSYLLTTQRDISGHSEYIGLRGRDLPLEMRPPLLDVDLVEFALRLPPEIGYGHINRVLARDSVRGDLPDSVRLAAAKSNLRAYYHRALTGPDLRVIRDIVGAPDARIREFADAAHVSRLLERPPSVGDRGWSAWAAPVWRLLTAEIALRAAEDPGFPAEALDRADPPQPVHEVVRQGVNGA